MLCIANGAFKSGSTWLYNILAEITGFPPPPAEYLNAAWKNPSLAPDKLPALLADLKPDSHYLVKNHFGKAHERDLLLASPHVRVFDIQRDLRDVVVSAYFHLKRNEGYTGDFATYYWQHGHTTARDVIKYHRVWSKASSGYFLASYEQLHQDFPAEVRRIADFLKIPVDTAKIEQIRQVTTLENLRERYGEQDEEHKFFRKGVVGDWQHYFDEPMLADLQALMIPPPTTLLTRIKQNLRSGRR